MTDSSGDRSAYFPAVEAKHGQPVKYWFDRLAELGDVGYPDQMALLRDRYGFSRVHANAVVMHHRGSPSARRFADPEEYFAHLDPVKANTARAVFAAIMEEFPELELVIAWNQPMLRLDGRYLFGLSAAKAHLTIAPWSSEVLDALRSELRGYTVNKKTVRIPVDWPVDRVLLRRMISLQLAEEES